MYDQLFLKLLAVDFLKKSGFEYEVEHWNNGSAFCDQGEEPLEIEVALQSPKIFVQDPTEITFVLRDLITCEYGKKTYKILAIKT